MREGDSVIVECTDTDRTSKGTVVRTGRDTITVTLNEARGTLLVFKKVKPKLFVGTTAGLEFVIRV
jgi:hypothetical protein